MEEEEEDEGDEGARCLPTTRSGAAATEEWEACTGEGESMEVERERNGGVKGKEGG